jgi:quinol monooxygenase YgiN
MRWNVYGIRRDITVSPADLGEFEALNKEVNDLARNHPGFVSAVLLESAGYPGRFTRLSNWESRGAARAFIRTPELAALAKRIQALSAPVQPAEGYEVIDLVREPGQAGIAAINTWTVSPSKAEAFEESRKALFQQRRKEVRGIATQGLARSLANPARYFVYISFLSEDDLTAYVTSPRMQEFIRTQAYREYADAPPTGEMLDMVLALVPA